MFTMKFIRALKGRNQIPINRIKRSTLRAFSAHHLPTHVDLGLLAQAITFRALGAANPVFRFDVDCLRS